MNSLCKYMGSTGLVLLAAVSANAADLPAKAYAPAPVVAQVYNWTGLYVGVNGGYGWGTQDPLTPLSNRFDRTSFSTSGGMVGGTIGAQIQQGYIVLGIEGDLDWANIKGSGIAIPSIAGIAQPFTLNIASNISAVGTARIRAGVAMNNWLFYATGGAAFVNSSANGTNIAGVACGTLGILPNCSASAWRPGLAAGLGTEWGFMQNWTAKLEYLYIDVVGSGFSTDHINTVRAGVNYRF
jgi:outer membrane immunogenic protein